jgi:hypothetical protein
LRRLDVASCGQEGAGHRRLARRVRTDMAVDYARGRALEAIISDVPIGRTDGSTIDLSVGSDIR